MSHRLTRGIEAGTLPNDLLCCGAAGTGKTYGILAFLHVLADQEPGLRILFCRATRAALTESVLVTYEQEILRDDGMDWLAAGCQRRVRQSYKYPNGSEIVCGGLDNPQKVLSTTWDFVFLNEAIEATEDAWEMILARMSRPGRDSRFGFLIGDTNPGHPTHWLKARCDRNKTALWDTRHEANPRMHDGRDWTDEGRRYLAKLDQLTGTRRKRLRDGLWAVGEGLWFDSFDPDRHVSLVAEYTPDLPVYLAVDPGVFTGAVLFQVHEASGTPSVTVFADYLAEGLSAERNADAITILIRDRTGPDATPAACYADPAGGAKNPVGPTVFQEYARRGLPLNPWSPANPSVAASLDNVEQLLNPIGGEPRLLLHPRCNRLVDAFASYKRAKKQDQWVDWPEDPQHPAEDLIDALRGGLHARLRRTLTMKIRTHFAPTTEDDDD